MTPVAKLDEGATDIPTADRRGRVALVVNTPSGHRRTADGAEIRRAAVRAGDTVHHDVEAAEATTEAIAAAAGPTAAPVALQDLGGRVGRPGARKG